MPPAFESFQSRFRVSFGAQLSPSVLEVTNQLLLLCVHRYRRLPRSLKPLNLSVDLFKLCVAVRIAAAFQCFPVTLKAEAEFAQQASHQHMAVNRH